MFFMVAGVAAQAQAYLGLARAHLSRLSERLNAPVASGA